MNKKIVKCLYTNADALTNKLSELKALIKIHKPEIVGVTEVKPKNLLYALTKATLKIEGYKLIPNDECLNDKGRGVLLYVHDSIANSCTEIKVSMGVESVWIRLSLNNNECAQIGCIYRSPNNDDTSDDQFLDEFSKLGNVSNDVDQIIFGDFNFPEISWMDESCSKDMTHVSSRFLESTREASLIQHITEPTRWRDGQQSNTLDLLFTNKDGLISDMDILPPIGKSDHGTIIFNLHCDYQHPEQPKRKMLFNKGNYTALRKELDVDWEPLLAGKSTEECWTTIKERILSACNKHIPIITINNKSGWKQIWMTSECIAKVKEKCKAWRIYMKSKQHRDKLKYSRARNQARWACRKAVKDYERNIAKMTKKNAKAFWKYINSKLKNKDPVAELETNTGRACSDQDKANELNTFFKSVFTEEDNSSLPSLPRKEYENPLNSIEVEEKEVREFLENLNANKSPGPDNLNPRVLLEASAQLAKPFTILFTKSLQEGKLPTEWKNATITPIFKNKGSKHKATNYRPVSLTSIACKILEKIIRKKIMDHMNTNKFFTVFQHGFLEGRSCVTNLLSTMDYWTRTLDEKGAIDCIYLDFRKAFDSVPHRRLLHKMDAYGIQLKWLEDFLIGRSQQVSVNGSTSAKVPVTSGVPQGSVLGPVMFLIYINDLPECVESAVRIFADDTKIFRKVDSVTDCRALQHDINKLEQWASTWKMQFHPDKCEVLRVGKSHPPFHYQMGTANNTCILQQVDSVKDLGVTVDDQLSFEQHCNIMISKASRILAIIRRSFSHIDEEMMVQLYKSLVRPYLEYANDVWSPRLMRNIHALEAVQRRATKLIPHLSHLPYEERLSKLKLPSLVYRRNRNDMIQVFKYVHNIWNCESSDFLQRVSEQRTRGHKYKLYKNRWESALRGHFFTNRIVNLWNELPDEITNAESVNSFKQGLDDFWSTKDWLYEYEAYKGPSC